MSLKLVFLKKRKKKLNVNLPAQLMQFRKNPVVMLPSLSRIIPTAEPQWVVPSEPDWNEQVSSTWEEEQASASFAKHL